MSDILIRHCTLRIVRRGGWSWGPDPAKLVQSAIGRVAELLERRLPEFWSHQDDEDIEIATPVRIRVPVRLHELLEIPSERHEESGFSGAPLEKRLERAIDAAFAPFIASPAFPPAPSDHQEELSESHAAAEEVGFASDENPKGSILRMLSSWHECGLLSAFLADFSPQALEAWHRRLVENTGEAITRTLSLTPEELTVQIRAIAEEATEQVSPIPGEQSSRQADRAAQLRLRLLVAVEAATRFGIEPHHPALLRALDLALRLSDASVEVSNPRLGSLVSVQTLDSVPLYRPWQGEFSISSALPYLLLGPLSRIGYLEALAACLDVAELLSAAPLFAHALACKVLTPPERGWRRHRTDVFAATVFAGLMDPVETSELADFARKISPYLSPLDTILKESLIAGHNPDRPLLLQRLDAPKSSGLLLIDVEGIFPIAWATDLDNLIPTLIRFGETALLVPQASLEAAPLDRLDEAGFRFITDAPPTRHETWRALRQLPDYRFWTNDRTSPESRLIALASPMAEVTEEASTLWQALAAQRPSIPRASDQALDRSLTLAAAAALGTIAWVLWREREPVAPYLALDRFHDLDARVCVDQHTVRVRLPLGRRYRDLYEHGVLLDVPDVPWLGGRILQFSGG